MDIARLIIVIFGTIMSILWIILFFKGKNRFTDILDAIDDDQFFLAELFFIGFEAMELLHFKMSDKRSSKKIKEISEIYGAKYAQFHFYVLRGGQFTYAITIFTIAILLTGLSGEMLLLPFGIVIAALLVYYLEDSLNDKIKKRREELLLDFPNMLSKLTLLVNSGMVMREAWRKIAVANNRELYREMRITLDEMDNGVSEIDAYMNFANRCYVKEIRKFATTMIQNLQKGSAELVAFLQDMSDEMWENKKYLIKKKGDAAASKLMIPTVMIFLGILVMILVPMLAGMEI